MHGRAVASSEVFVHLFWGRPAQNEAALLHSTPLAVARFGLFVVAAEVAHVSG